ncbi:uncharacterized protein LOC133740406 isoform X1 [Rosa rugosa]|uniref:uncharacterized protein LOC133740406 isoform X1 n=1 Tax=Rosa rugosa TaxID=74645 RepID=UPI002B402E9F|nr:uncharacterized protein LOC133740406 isoform X1 [Rosa rugosa]
MAFPYTNLTLSLSLSSPSPSPPSLPSTTTPSTAASPSTMAAASFRTCPFYLAQFHSETKTPIPIPPKFTKPLGFSHSHPSMSSKSASRGPTWLFHKQYALDMDLLWVPTNMVSLGLLQKDSSTESLRHHWLTFREMRSMLTAKCG